jgi:hypothetical protein
VLIGHPRQNFAALQAFDTAAEMFSEVLMSRNLPIIGVEPNELPWLRMLVSLLRHPDPVVPELAHQALLYLQNAASPGGGEQALPVDATGTTGAAN